MDDQRGKSMWRVAALSVTGVIVLLVGLIVLTARVPQPTVVESTVVGAIGAAALCISMFLMYGKTLLKNIPSARVATRPESAFVTGLVLLLGPASGALAFLLTKAVGEAVLSMEVSRLVRGAGPAHIRVAKWSTNVGSATAGAATAAAVAFAVYPLVDNPVVYALLVGTVAAAADSFVASLYLSTAMSDGTGVPWGPMFRTLSHHTWLHKPWYHLLPPTVAWSVSVAPELAPVLAGGMFAIVRLVQRSDAVAEQNRRYQSLLDMAAGQQTPASVASILDQLTASAATATHSARGEIRAESPDVSAGELGVMISEDTPEGQRWLIVGDHVDDSPYIGRDRIALESIASVARKALAAANERQALTTSASTDALTGLLNRTGLERALVDDGMFDGVRNAALMLFGLDRFTNLNRVYGPVAGDAVLLGVARRVVEQTDRMLVAARYEDRIAVLVPADHRPDLTAETSRLLDVVSSPQITPDGIRVTPKATAAVVTFEPDGGDGAEQVLATAEQMLRSRKAVAPGTVVSEAIGEGWVGRKFKDAPVAVPAESDAVSSDGSAG